ncbi:MAG: glycoside hydrolase family 127 protein, partial [Chitinophagaceae bacterium]
VPSDLYRFVSDVKDKPEIKVNGAAIDYRIEKGYAVIKRQWKKGDVMEMNLPMEVKRVTAHQNIIESKGKVALERGPLVYCIEGVDNYGKSSNIILPSDAILTVEHKPTLLNGITVLTADLPSILISENGQSITTQKRTVTAIPYYAWANREQSEMVIWLPEKVKDVDLLAVDVKK